MNTGIITKKNRLPAKIESLLAILSASYARKNEEMLQQVVVNATYTIEEDVSYDNWNGGQSGHLIRLAIPAELFGEAMDALSTIENRIATDLNSIARCPNENIDSIVIEQAETEDILKWREKSGALLMLQKSKKEMSEAEGRLWTKGCVRAFLSHKAEHKQQATDLKVSFKNVGVSAFVAHQDIEPTREWQDEIELALSTQDVCVTLLTEGFRNSNWTDQEIGISIGRGVPIVAVRLGQDPYGFIGKFQAFSGIGKSSEEIADELVQAFLLNKRLQGRMASALVQSFETAKGYTAANRLMEHIKALPSLSEDLVQRLENAPEQNSGVKRAYKVQNSLAGVISRLRVENYVF